MYCSDLPPKRRLLSLLAATCLLLVGNLAQADDYDDLELFATEPQVLPLPSVAVTPESAFAPDNEIEFELIPPPEEEIVAEPLEIGPPVPKKKNWEISFELGTNGSRGNSDTFNFRFGSHFERRTPRTVLLLDLLYKQDSQNDQATADRLYFTANNDWLFPNSPWSVFLENTTEYDQFTAYDSRVTVNSGLTYSIFAGAITSLSVRGGAGGAWELGGEVDDEEFVPQGVLGFNFDRRIFRRQKLRLSVDYFPDFTEFNEFRLVGDASIEFLLDEEHQISLVVGVIDRYDSTPNGAEPNDLDYSAVLLWAY